jgi:hypothetical protein
MNFKYIGLPKDPNVYGISQALTIPSRKWVTFS